MSICYASLGNNAITFQVPIEKLDLHHYLPLFFEETATVFDYLPKDAVFVSHGDAPGAIHARSSSEVLMMSATPIIAFSRAR